MEKYLEGYIEEIKKNISDDRELAKIIDNIYQDGFEDSRKKKE